MAVYLCTRPYLTPSRQEQHQQEKDNTACSKAGAVDTHVPKNFPLNTGTARGMLIPCHAQKAGTTHKWCDPLPSRVKNQSGGTPLGNTSLLTRSTLKDMTPYRYNSQFSLRHLCFNLNREVDVIVGANLDVAGHRGGFHSWSRGHENPTALPIRAWICQIQAHSMSRSEGWHN